MPSLPAPSAFVSRPTLWFGLLGGAIAWLAHLLLAYAVAEFGCVALEGSDAIAALTPVAWMLLGVSVLAVIPAAAATLVAFASMVRLRQASSMHEVDRYLAKSGAIASGAFLFIIIVESIPIFFYLHHC